MSATISNLINQAVVARDYGPAGTVQALDPELLVQLTVRACAELARQHNLVAAERSHLVHRALLEHFEL
jgi:hypothetical protein